MGNPEKESLTKPLDYEIFVHHEAQLEVQETFYRYQDLNEGLGFEFMRSTATQFIKRNPLSYQKIYGEIRRVLLRKFPTHSFIWLIKNE